MEADACITKRVAKVADERLCPPHVKSIGWLVARRARYSPPVYNSVVVTEKVVGTQGTACRHKRLSARLVLSVQGNGARGRLAQLTSSPPGAEQLQVPPPAAEEATRVAGRSNTAAGAQRRRGDQLGPTLDKIGSP
jgi:hypothetical protein